ncbi:Thiol-disulfide oxidoreductase ResA [uncultured archaeon]|nr:Thiol-disulfide oxidoreductase ResA [uncultured archaeon]
MSSAQELTAKEFDKFTEKGLVLVDFFAEWCMPCLMMGPVIDELADKFKGKIKFAKVNVEDNSPLSAKFSISSIPCFILFKNGKVLERFVGAMSSEDFEEKLEGFL